MAKENLFPLIFRLVTTLPSRQEQLLMLAEAWLLVAKEDLKAAWRNEEFEGQLDAWFRGQVYASLRNRRLNFVIVSEGRKQARFENSDLQRRATSIHGPTLGRCHGSPTAH